jgi:hypothetical protein
MFCLTQPRRRLLRQGSEAETVIYAATASDSAALERSEDFYSSICRANVAFSRTRRRLIVVASRAFLTHLPTSYSRYEGLLLWRQLRSMTEERGRHVGEAHVAVAMPYCRTPLLPARGAQSVPLSHGAAGAEAGGGVAGAGGAQDVTVTYRCDMYEAVYG